MEGETIVRALHDVVAAKGYEKNTMFREVAQLIGALPRLEGTVHVNVGLVLKFMPNYMLNPKEYPQIPTRNDAADDVFFWNQGPTRGAAQGAVRRLDAGLRRAPRDPECRPVLRAGAGVQAVPRHRCPECRPAEGSGLPARRRPPVLVDRLRAADSRAGGADRRRRRHRRPDLRLPDPRLQHVCRCRARQAEFDAGTAGLGAATRSANRCPTPRVSAGCGNGSRPTTAPTRWRPDRLRFSFRLCFLVSTNLASGICICSGAAASRSAMPASSRSKNCGDRGRCGRRPARSPASETPTP